MVEDQVRVEAPPLATDVGFAVRDTVGTGGVTVTVAALADVIRSKEAANREKDNMQLPILRRTLEQTRVRGRGHHGREQ